MTAISRLNTIPASLQYEIHTGAGGRGRSGLKLYGNTGYVNINGETAPVGGTHLFFINNYKYTNYFACKQQVELHQILEINHGVFKCSPP